MPDGTGAFLQTGAARRPLAFLAAAVAACLFSALSAQAQSLSLPMPSENDLVFATGEDEELSLPATGGTPPYTYTWSGGFLSFGVTFDSATGVVTARVPPSDEWPVSPSRCQGGGRLRNE